MRTKIFIWLRDLALWVYGYECIGGANFAPVACPPERDGDYMQIYAKRRGRQ